MNMPAIEGKPLLSPLQVSHGSQTGNTPILLPPAMALGTLALAVGMCAGASVISIRKATTIDPAMVFRG